jgi:PBP1b-binding outer membrane lipoprotein LpoB
VKLFIAIILCFLFLTGCSEPLEHSPPQPTTHTTIIQQQQLDEEERQRQENEDMAVQASIDAMLSVVNQ